MLLSFAGPFAHFLLCLFFSDEIHLNVHYNDQPVDNFSSYVFTETWSHETSLLQKRLFKLCFPETLTH